MAPAPMRSPSSSEASWLRPLWIAALIAAISVLTTIFACITPFAAFGVIAATAVSHRRALWLTAALWLANQAAGFGVLHYPWTVTTVAWGVAIGAAAVLGTLTASTALRRLLSLAAPLRVLAAFVAAFAAYELTLYAVALGVLGGTGAFSPLIVGQVLIVNAVTLVGLYGLDQLVVGLEAAVGRRRGALASPQPIA